MSDVILPPWLKFARTGIRYVDATGISEAEFTGYTRTASRGGDRLRASLEFTPTGTSAAGPAVERRAVKRFLTSLKGKQNRALLFDPAYVRAGSFPSNEVLTNPTFENGTTGWNTYNSTLSAHDRTLRLASDGTTTDFGARQSVSGLVQYAPYVYRAGFSGSFVYTPQLIAELQSGSILNNNVVLAASGMPSVAMVAHATTAEVIAWHNSGGGVRRPRYLDLVFQSLARCALADAQPNAFQRSDEIDNAYWSKSGVSVSANANTATDGTVTADRIIEDSSTGQHFFNRSETRASAAEDWCAFGDFFRVAGSRNVRLVIQADASNFAEVTINLGDGSTAAAPSVTGAASNARFFAVNMGAGIWRCFLVARLPATINVVAGFYMASGAANSYTGDGSSSIGTWRCGAAPSSVPLRGGQTTSAATTGTAPTGSGAMYLKGLPASTNGLLLPSDQVEVITSRGSELKLVTAPLNSDAAGLGYLQFEPPLRGTVADNAAVIVHQPMGRFLFAGDAAGWDEEPGIVTRASAEFIEV